MCIFGFFCETLANSEQFLSASLYFFFSRSTSYPCCIYTNRKIKITASDNKNGIIFFLPSLVTCSSLSTMFTAPTSCISFLSFSTSSFQFFKVLSSSSNLFRVCSHAAIKVTVDAYWWGNGYILNLKNNIHTLNSTINNFSCLFLKKLKKLFIWNDILVCRVVTCLAERSTNQLSPNKTRTEEKKCNNLLCTAKKMEESFKMWTFICVSEFAR